MKLKVQQQGSFYPRKKHTLYNLSELLNHKVIEPPELTLSMRLFPHKGLSVSPEKNPQNEKKNSKKSLAINFQHYRIKSSLQNRTKPSVALPQDKLTSLQKKNRKSFKKTSSHLQPDNPEIKGKSLDKIYKSQQLFSNSLLKSRTLELEKLQSTQLQRCQSIKQYSYSSVDNLMADSLKTSMSRSVSSIASVPLQKATIKAKGEFLKKGSSVQKQIVVNLLRNKLIRQHNNGGSGILQKDNPYNNQDILKMIKVYRGGVDNEVANSSLKKRDTTHNYYSPQKGDALMTAPKDLKLMQTHSNHQSSPLQNLELVQRSKVHQIEAQENKTNKKIQGWQTGEADYDMDQNPAPQEEEISSQFLERSAGI